MSLSFETARLIVSEVTDALALSERAELIGRIPAILTPRVVENLPPSFHGICSAESAEIWLDRVLSESRLLLVKSTEQGLIGFLFVHVENENEAHIGYLLAEACWGKGFASELLEGFIREASAGKQWSKIIGGVDPSNIASINLLKKLGFSERVGGESGVLTYEYAFLRCKPPLR